MAELQKQRLEERDQAAALLKDAAQRHEQRVQEMLQQRESQQQAQQARDDRRQQQDRDVLQMLMGQVAQHSTRSLCMAGGSHLL